MQRGWVKGIQGRKQKKDMYAISEAISWKVERQCRSVFRTESVRQPFSMLSLLVLWICKPRNSSPMRCLFRQRSESQYRPSLTLAVPL